jgi:hypothetical protein
MSPCFQADPGDGSIARQGIYQSQEECETDCSQEGACCSGESCEQTTRCQCKAEDGKVFIGAGTTCESNPCPCSIPDIESIEVTIEATDYSAQFRSSHPGYNCGFYHIGVTQVFRGSQYTGTFSLSYVGPGPVGSGNTEIWEYVFSGDCRIGYIRATVYRNDFIGAVGMLLQAHLGGITDGDITQTTPPRGPNDLDCVGRSPDVGGLDANGYATNCNPPIQPRFTSFGYPDLPLGIYVPCSGNQLSFSQSCTECKCPYGNGCVGYDRKCFAEQVYSETGAMRGCITGLSVTYQE